MSKMLTSFRWIPIFFLLLVSAGCGNISVIRRSPWVFDPEVHSREDIEKIFVLHRGRWWNYYERGLTFMKGGFWEGAIGDFNISISKMPEDHRGAKTYGLNQIDYYANRESGIAHYIAAKNRSTKTEENNYNTQAYKHLTASLKSVESSRT